MAYTIFSIKHATDMIWVDNEQRNTRCPYQGERNLHYRAGGSVKN